MDAHEPSVRVAANAVKSDFVTVSPQSASAPAGAWVSVPSGEVAQLVIATDDIDVEHELEV